MGVALYEMRKNRQTPALRESRERRLGLSPEFKELPIITCANSYPGSYLRLRKRGNKYKGIPYPKK